MLDATSITPITEDIVTLASDAAADILNDDDKKAIDMVIVLLSLLSTSPRLLLSMFTAS